VTIGPTIGAEQMVDPLNGGANSIHNAELLPIPICDQVVDYPS